MDELKFIIRVYGIFIDHSKGLLVSDEIIKGRQITKFPGGGLEYGEGTIDCLKREMLEETGYHFEVIEHFYTTDYFVESAFHTDRQVLSIYYKIKPAGDFDIKTISANNQNESFRFIPANKMKPKDFTLSIDRHVASLLSSL